MTNIHTHAQPFHISASTDLASSEFLTDSKAEFLTVALDLSRGIKTCLSLVHASHLARENNDDDCPAPLNAPDTESLTRMAMAATHMLSEKINIYIEVFNDLHLNCQKHQTRT